MSDDPDCVNIDLIQPARYAPFASGRYEIAPGLSRFGKDFGNGQAERRVFQIDREFPRFRASKLAARAERFERYVCQDNLDPDSAAAVVGFMINRLITEYPHFFQLDADESSNRLQCRLTDEAIALTRDNLIVSGGSPATRPAYRDTLDALACQVQEDIAIVRRDPTSGVDTVSYLHLCSPNHWAAEDKIGRDFVSVHAPVAGIGPINRNASAHVGAMISAEQGLVRFAWGISTDDQLNHHPRRSVSAARRFDESKPRAFVRIERQTIWGFPNLGAALFTIRTYFTDIASMLQTRPDLRDALVAAIESMTRESLVYKGIAEYRDSLLRWIRARPAEEMRGCE